MQIKQRTFLAVVLTFSFLTVGNIATGMDTLTLNLSTTEGVEGSSFIPSEFFGQAAFCTGLANTSGNCDEHGKTVISAWLNGGYFLPLNGTGIIPSSASGKETGYRLMLEAAFSPGEFLSGFALFAEQFGTPGANGSNEDALLAFIDHPWAPLTSGRAPNTVPDERQAWADTLMVKYVASSSGEFSQSLRSQVGQWRGTGPNGGSNTVSWTSTTDENGEDCECIWEYETDSNGLAGNADGTLRVDKGSGFVDFTSTTPNYRIDRLFGMLGNGGDGTVMVDIPLSPIEMVPTVVDSRLDQGLTQFGDTETGLQVLRYQFQVVSGPNIGAEAIGDPYTYIICGSRTGGAGETDCDDASTEIIGQSNDFAFVNTNDGTINAVFNLSARYGPDERYFTEDDGWGTDGTKGTSDDTIVMCGFVGAGGTSTTDGRGFTVWQTSCESDPGLDLIYGTSDDGVVYYKENAEDGFRTGGRDHRAIAHSEIDANAQLRQIMEQDISDSVSGEMGILISCLNCNAFGEHAPFAAPGPLSYDQLFPQIPSIVIGPHPPNQTTIFEVVAAPITP